MWKSVSWITRRPRLPRPQALLPPWSFLYPLCTVCRVPLPTAHVICLWQAGTTIPLPTAHVICLWQADTIIHNCMWLNRIWLLPFCMWQPSCCCFCCCNCFVCRSFALLNCNGSGLHTRKLQLHPHLHPNIQQEFGTFMWRMPRCCITQIAESGELTVSSAFPVCQLISPIHPLICPSVCLSVLVCFCLQPVHSSVCHPI